MLSRVRRGFALLGAMMLLALASALVVGTFSLARSLRRAAITAHARARAESGVPRALGEVLQGWNPVLDSLTPDGGIAVILGTDTLDAGTPVGRLARVARVGTDLYTITVDVCAYDCAHPIAQRRARLWLRRTTSPADSAGPTVVTPWAFSDLY